MSKEYATVTTACEVSFAVGHLNYGTINVPVGTKVFRHNDCGKWSDWFVADADVAKLCPDGMKINGEPSAFYLHDGTHYGITMPNANVRKDGEPKAVHKAHHY